MHMKTDKIKDTPDHGGNVFEIAREMGLDPDDIVDFSANINPLGMPDGVRQAAMNAFDVIGHYPDTDCWDLKYDLAHYLGLDPEEIMVGNGSTELIYLVVRALKPRKALIVGPAFTEYERALKIADVPFEYHSTAEEDDFQLSRTPDVKDHDLVFLANPTNPSGKLLAPEKLRPILEDLNAAGVQIILDEAFIDFLDNASMKDAIRDLDRLVILRSFTKFFGIPGIRLGFALSRPETIDRMGRFKEPWAVSTIAKAVGQACLKDTDFMARSRETVDRERRFLGRGLSEIPGLKVFPGSVNYYLVKLTPPQWTAAGLRRAVLAHGVIIRDAGNFIGLDQSYFRVAVRSREENERLLQALRSCLKED